MSDVVNATRGVDALVVQPVTGEQRRAAALTVVRLAKDRVEAREFLEMLGLAPAARRRQRAS